MENIISETLRKELLENRFEFREESPLKIRLVIHKLIETFERKIRILLIGNETPGITIINEDVDLDKEMIIIDAKELELIAKAKYEQQEYLKLHGIETKLSEEFTKNTFKEAFDQVLNEEFRNVLKELFKKEDVKLYELTCPYCGQKETIPMSIGIRRLGKNHGIRYCEHKDCGYTYLVNYDRDTDTATSDLIEKHPNFEEMKNNLKLKPKENQYETN